MIKSPEKDELQRRLRKTLKNFDLLLKPLHELIRIHTTKVQENYSKGPLYMAEYRNVKYS